MTKWWHASPVRLVQTNLREVDTKRDPCEIVREASAFGANAILFSVGGIVSFYPTKLRFQTPIPSLKQNATSTPPLYQSAVEDDAPVRDFVFEALQEAQAQGLRFIARLDLSKCHKHVYESRPGWFFRRLDGHPQIYNGLYSTCVNGGYYQSYAFEIMQEILDRYDIDGFFFNMFGYHPYDYSGNYHGLCQCENCKRRFRDMFGRALPQHKDVNDPAYLDYIEFKRVTSEELTQRIADFIHRDDNLALVNFQIKAADIVRSESNTAIDRPLPLWQFSGSDNVKRVRGTYPTKPNCNAAVYFVDIPYRFASVSSHQTQLRLAQDLAYGGDVDLYVLGTLQQPDRQGLDDAQQIFSFAAQHRDVYQGMRSLAQTCLLYPQRSYDYDMSSRAAYRGAFRLLSEHHILFDCAHDSILDNQRRDFLHKYQLLVLPGAACLSDRQRAAIDQFVEAGGSVLATGETGLYTELGRPLDGYGLQSLGVERVRTMRTDMRSAYFRESTPLLQDTELVLLDRSYFYVDCKPKAETSLKLIPPCTYGPPEKVAIDQIETDLPGIVWFRYGAGQTAYLPWMLDALYYRHSSPGHSTLFASLLSRLQPVRQLVTNAGPQVEFSLMKNRSGYLVNAVNVSGHHGTAFFPPILLYHVKVQVRLPDKVTSATSLALDRALDLHVNNEYTCFSIDELDLFDTIQLQ